MSTLEDRILGEKKEYYCSSSEDEGDSNPIAPAAQKSKIPSQPSFEWQGSSTNTGPKGVIKDWQCYKQLENEKREGKEAEHEALLKKLSMTCQTAREEQEQKKKAEKDAIDAEIETLVNDDFLKKYMHDAMQEMYSKLKQTPKFGAVVSLSSGEEFLHAIDKENKSVTVIVLLYEETMRGCEAMMGCLTCLAQDHQRVKFCKIKASTAGVSLNFKISGIPALLVYKAGSLVGNFVGLGDEFGEDFYASDVEGFLIEHGILPDNSLVPEIIREASVEGVSSSNDD